jgi:uncharacterized protein (TIGR02284 family)
MQNSNEKITSVLKDLIKINNDRVEGYKTAASETKESDLKALFEGFSSQSRTFTSELEKLVPGGITDMKDTTKDTTASGKLYRVWMDIKSALTANDRKAVLSSCEFGEDAALKEYNNALDKKADLPENILEVIRSQKSKIQMGHDKVKSMRDALKV